MLVGVREELQEELKKRLNRAGIKTCVWYECEGDEEIVIVPPEMVKEEGFLVDMEVRE